jgi:hypothetical protein
MREKDEKVLGDAFKKVTTPVGVVFALQQHRDFSQPFHRLHSPPKGNRKITDGRSTHEKPTLNDDKGDDCLQLHPDKP